MSDYVGVIELKKPISCQKEVSGKSFKTQIANLDVLIIFPSIPNDYDPTKGPNPRNGDLLSPVIYLKERRPGERLMHSHKDFFQHIIFCAIFPEQKLISTRYMQIFLVGKKN